MSRLLLTPVATFLALTVAQSALAQSAPAAATSKPDYSQEPYVIERLGQRVEFQSDGTSTSETNFRAKVQTDGGVQGLGLLVFQYQQANDALDVSYVRVLKPDGTIVATPAGNIQDLPAEVTREAPFYSDIREKHVAVRGLSTGDTLEYQVRNHANTPLVPGQFWLVDDFNRATIVLEETLEVSVPADRSVKTKFGELKPTVTEEGGRRIYRWKTSNLRRKSEEESKAERPAEPPPPAVQFTTFQNYEEVGRWYDQLQRERVEPSPEIRAKALELTRDAKTDDEKLRTIYSYVALKFRYIGIGFGIGRYQPNSAADVLANQYGDCKDKHTLLASLLAAAGIPAYPVLINSTRKIDPDMPSPSQFNHVITAVPRDGQFIWLDTTAEVAPFGFLLDGVRDKQALLMPTAAAPALVKTPAEPSIANFLDYQIEGKITDAGALEAKVSQTFRGDSEIFLRAAFRSVPQPQWKDLVQGFSAAYSSGGTVSNVDASAPEATDAPFRIKFEYLRKDYPGWENQRITMPFPPLGLPLLRDEKEEERKKLELGGDMRFVYQVKIELPGEVVPALPASLNLTEEYAEYSSAYSFKDKVLSGERLLIIKAKDIPKEKFEAYRKFTQAANDDIARIIRLVPSSGGAAVAESSLGGSQGRASSSYVDLMREGAGLIQSRNLEGGIAKLREALALEPECSMCHETLAQALIDKGDRAGAILEYRELVRLEPSNADYHHMLGLQLEAQGTSRANTGAEKASRDDFEAAALQYRIAQELDTGNKSYRKSYERLQRQLKNP